MTREDKKFCVALICCVVGAVVLGFLAYEVCKCV